MKYLVATALASVSMGIAAAGSSATHGDGTHSLCENPTITAGPGSDVILGTQGDDVITGGLGPDIIRGRGGDDKICGLKSNDTLIGGADNDKLHGGHANDTLLGKGGFDKAYGGASTDTCNAEREQSCEGDATAN